VCPQGEVIFMERPLLCTQTLPSMQFPCCSQCVRSLIQPQDVFSPEELARPMISKAVSKYWPVRKRVPCQCGKEVYCSQECKEDAWSSHHK
jgi:hypothetical protein